MPIPPEGDSRSASQWVASHPFLLFGFGSLVFVLLAVFLEVGPDTPAAIIVRIIIWPMYAGWMLAMLITRALFGPGSLSDLGVFVMRFLMIPFSLAPYLLLDWLLGKVRHRSGFKRPNAPIPPT